MRLAVCEGSVLVLLSGSFYFLLPKKKKKKEKKNNNSKWVCMWVLHAIVIICTGVPETYVARSPISKKASSPAALTRYRQPHPKRLYNFTSSPRPRSRSLTCGGGGTEGGEALCFLLPPDSSRHQWWKIFFCVCVHKLLVNPADRLQAGDEWEHWLLLHNTHKLTLKYIYIYICIWVRPSGLQDSQLPGVTDVPSGCRV